MKKIAILLFLLTLMGYGVWLATKTQERRRRSVKWGGWLYGIASLVLWLILYLTGDRWWPATVCLFGLCWLWFVPLIPLVIAALLVRPKTLRVLLPTAWVVLFPVMGLHVPWSLMIPSHEGGAHLRILTCNLHGQHANALAALVGSERPDVVVVQEWVERRPAVTLGRPDWHFCRTGELYVASRYPLRRVDNLAAQYWRGPGDAVSYELDTPGGLVHLINLRLASPHMQLEDLRWHSPLAPAEIQANSVVRLRQSQTISRYAKELGAATLLAGDLNTPQGSVLFRWCWEGFTDVFTVSGWGFGNTYCAPWVSTRIDHILASSAWRCRGCWVGPDVGSPHRPVIADLELVDPPGN